MYCRKGREQKIKNFGGDFIILGLKLKQEYSNKDYNLYTIYKLVNGEEIPIYNENMTKKEVNEFLNNPSYYKIDEKNKEDHDDI